MGYTHYWERTLQLSPYKFAKVSSDFAKLVHPMSAMGIRLAGGDGADEPIITPKEIVFNGSAACGHAKNAAVSIPWPDSRASGLGNSVRAISGDWFAGAKLSTRTCNGDCSYETFALECLHVPYHGQTPDANDGRYFSFCKTAFRPYDIAVTAVLIIAKHHYGDDIRVSSDGEDQHWQDAKRLCYAHLGFGPEYEITDDGLACRPLSRESIVFTDADRLRARSLGVAL